MSNSDITKKPKPGPGDVAHTAGKAAFSLIPGIGGAAAELFSKFVVAPISKRQEEWILSIAKALQALEEKVENFKIENLVENETFITALMHASQVASRNHQKEKLEALRSAVLNAASPTAPEEDLQLMFLNFIDTLTPWHLRILKYFEDPMGWGERHNVKFTNYEFGSPMHPLQEAFPELRTKGDFVDHAVKDLYSKGLMNTESLKTTMTKHGMFAPRITSTGQKFITYITNPLEEQ